MAGFFYIRILICFGIVSAVAAAVLGLCGQMIKQQQSLAPAPSQLRYCINSLEKAKAGIKTEATIETNPELGHNYRSISIQHHGLVFTTAQLANQTPTAETNEKQKS